ncbi:hypothetical protein AGMMS4957_19250 [Bacteroidia bacterium]|nr:hypothetical protein AGMMS4957_19250 [Bacteroidia bacterium]
MNTKNLFLGFYVLLTIGCISCNNKQTSTESEDSANQVITTTDSVLESESSPDSKQSAELTDIDNTSKMGVIDLYLESKWNPLGTTYEDILNYLYGNSMDYDIKLTADQLHQYVPYTEKSKGKKIKKACYFDAKDVCNKLIVLVPVAEKEFLIAQCNKRFETIKENETWRDTKRKIIFNIENDSKASKTINLIYTKS